MRLFGLENNDVIARLNKEIKDRKQAWRRQREFFTLCDSLYYFERYGQQRDPAVIKGDEGIEVQVNDGTNVVDLTVGLLGETDIDLRAVPITPDMEGQRETSEVEAWMQGVLDANCDDQGREPHIDGLNDAVRLGMGVMQVYVDTSRECPFVIKSIDPYTVYPEEGVCPKGLWRSVIIEEKKPVAQIEEEWGVRIPKMMGKPYDVREAEEIEEIDYWGYEFVDAELAQSMSEDLLGTGAEGSTLSRNREERPPLGGESPGGGIQPGWYVVNCIMAGDYLIRPPQIVPGYEELPFVIWGCKQGGGRAFGKKRPEYYFLSALFPIHKAILLLDANMGALQKQVALFTNLPYGHYAGKMGHTDLQFEAGLGKVLKFRYPDERFEMPKWPGNPPDVFAAQSFHKRQIQEGSYSSVQLGEQAQLSGYAMSQVWQANLVRLSQPRRNWGYALKDMYRKIQSYAVNFTPDHPIAVLCNYKKILNKMVQMTGGELEPFIIDIELSTDLPQDEYRRRQMGILLAKLGPQSPFSLRTLSEDYFDVQQPEKEEELKIQEMMRSHQVVQALMLWRALYSQMGIYVPFELLLRPETAKPFQQALQGIQPQMVQQGPEERGMPAQLQYKQGRSQEGGLRTEGVRPPGAPERVQRRSRPPRERSYEGMMPLP